MTTSFVSLLTDSTSITGTGNVTTNGTAATGYKLLADIGPVGTKFDYRIGAPGAAEWEEGEGKVLSATSFSRSPLDSSNNNGLVNFSAGTKPVAHAVIASRMRKLHARTSPKVIYLSSFCESDTDLSPYAQKEGVDQRASIQAVLDIAKTQSNLRVVGDIKATVANVPNSDGDTLLLNSNTVVVWLPGCGLLQASGSKGDMWKNANPTTNVNNNANSITDERIGLIGGIFHGNREGQNNVKMDVFRFSGVRNLYTANYTIYRASGMGVRVINPDGWVNKDYLIDQGKDLLTAANSISINTDGVHVHGPANNIRDTNGRILNCGDDSYALNADDAWGAGSFTGRFDNVYGPITDVIVSSLHFEARYFGIRILSGNSRVHRVFFINTTGSTNGSAFRMDNYLTPSQTRAAGPGNCGLIVVDGWEVTTGMVDFSWGQMAMAFDCKVEQLLLKRIVKRDFNNAYFPAIRFGEKFQFDQLEVDYNGRNYNGGTYLADQIDFATGSQGSQADIKMRVHSSASVNGYPLHIRSGVTITQGEARGGQINFTGMMLNESPTTAAFVDNSKTSTAVAAPSTWTLQDPSYWTEDTSNPSTLIFKSNHSGVVDGFMKNTVDAYGGNVTVSDTLTWTGTNQGTGLHHALGCRASGLVPWSGHQSGYFFDVFTDNSSTGIKLFKTVAGADTTLTTVTAPFAIGNGYKFALTAKGSAISVVAQRTSDGYYLTSAGAWQSAAATAVSVTDTSIAAVAAGLGWGGYAYNENNPQVVTTLSNLAIAAAA